MRAIDERSIGRLSAYMFLPDDILEADYTIVLGMSLWQRPLRKVLELKDSRLSGTPIFSGGFNPKIGACEALAMRNGWIESGHPASEALVDDRSTNTHENMVNARALIEATRGTTRDIRVNIVTINYHMRRAVETFRKVFGDEPHVGVANYTSVYCDPTGWFGDERGRALVLGEAYKIRRYLPERAGELDHLPDTFEPAGQCGT